MLLTSANVNEIIAYYYGKIADVVEAALVSLPPEVSAEVRERGLFLCGGGSAVPGIDKYFYQKLQIPVTVAEEPAYCGILGGGKILDDVRLGAFLTED
jgi:rod shape-determining protein MreB